MTRSRLSLLHGAAASLALAIIMSFWSLALFCELAATRTQIVAIRSGILFTLPLLVLAMAATGATGSRLAGAARTPVLRAKTVRMRASMLNGLLVLIPAAIWLGLHARSGDLGAPFATVQAVELAAGAVNIALLGSNMRAGLRLSRRRRTT